MSEQVAATAEPAPVVIAGATIDPAIEHARNERAAARKAAAIAAYGAGPEAANDNAPPVEQAPTVNDNAATEQKDQPKEKPSEEAEAAPVEKPGDRVRKYLADRQEKAEAAKLKAEIAQLREQQEKALAQAREDARREAYERIKKQPKTAFEEAGLDPSGLVQSAMDEITGDPVRKLELQLEQQKSEFARARQELQELRDGLARRELQQQAESGQQYVLGFARKADEYPILNARYASDGALLQEYFTHAKEYHARTGEMPDPADMLAYMEENERSVYTKVYGAPNDKPKPAVRGRTKGISPAAAMQRQSLDAPGITPEDRRARAKEAYLKAVR